MHILVYEPSGEGGLALYTQHFCSALANRGPQVTWLTSSRFSEVGVSVPGVRVLPYLAPLRSKGRLLRIRPIWALDRVAVIGSNSVRRNHLARKTHPSVTHIQYLLPRIEQYAIGGLRKRSPVVITVHDVVPHSQGPRWSWSSLQKVFDAADHLIVHSQHNKDRLLERFSVPENKISVIYHGASAEPAMDKTLARDQIGLPAGVPVVLFFGTIRKNKGLDLLIPAFQRVVRDIGECILLIAGATPFGEDFAPYRIMLEEAGISRSAVVLNRFIETEEIPRLFSAADLVALPYTSFESQSGVLLTAYSYGKPVVVTDQGGLAEIVRQDETGEVADLSPESLSESIVSLLSDKERLKSASRNAGNAVTEKYSWDNVARQTIDVYSKVLGDRAGTV